MLRAAHGEHLPYEDLGLNLERAKKWHPLNRALYLGARVHLPGLLLNAKGDRVAMHSSVETRYPFLDEEVFAFLARLHPRWKMRGFGDKYCCGCWRSAGCRSQIAWRRKAMFRRPVRQLPLRRRCRRSSSSCSARSRCGKTGYFDVDAVLHWRQAFKQMRAGSTQRLSVEMGLAGVLSTQLGISSSSTPAWPTCATPDAANGLASTECCRSIWCCR